MTEVLFDILQKKSLDIQYCFSAIQRQIKKLEDMRNDCKAEEYFNIVNSTSDLKITRDSSTSSLAHYRQLYFEILDNIIVQLQTRFRDIQKLEFLHLVDSSRFSEFKKLFPC